MIFITTAQPWRVILLPRNRCVNSALIKKRDLCVLINICRQQAVVWTEPTPPRRSEEPTSGWRGTSWRPPTPVLSPPRQPVVRQLATNRLTGRRRGQEGRSTFPRSVSLDGAAAATGCQRKTQRNSTPNTRSCYVDEDRLLRDSSPRMSSSQNSRSQLTASHYFKS